MTSVSGALEQVHGEVHAEHAGKRLDVFLAQVLELGRRRAKLALASGHVKLDGRPEKRGSRLVEAGQRVELLREPADLQGEADADLVILLETPELVAVNKPAGQPTAPLASLERGSLAGALLGRYPEMRGVGHSPREPGLLHRLDTATSGVVLAARSARAFTDLQALHQEDAITKWYLAWVSGAPEAEAGRVETLLGPDPRHRKLVAVGGHYEATTHYEVLERRKGSTLLRLSVKRAYRHQIRVHMAHLGCPLLGDTSYAPPETSGLAPRLALHASRIRVNTSPPYQLDVEAPLPPGFPEPLA
ncbi:MAG: RluA family pseudouridine synthase [Myxococcales bacterium]|nr:RluA family pseudouridine synthase [Myxococcales bacterium]